MRQQKNLQEVWRLYEAMFLVDSELAADCDRVINTIKNILQKADAQIVSIRKWAERKLAYQIHGKNRGTYILCYFRAVGKRIGQIERDVRLSEQIMRVLILKAEGLREEDIKEESLAAPEETKQLDQGDAAEEGSGRRSRPAPVAGTPLGENATDIDDSEHAEIDDSKSQDAEDRQSQEAVDEGGGCAPKER